MTLQIVEQSTHDFVGALEARPSKPAKKILHTEMYVEYEEIDSILVNDSNRLADGVSEKHIKALMKDIRDDGFQRMFPVLVSKDFVVQDGHHRLEAAKRLKKGVWIRQVENEDILYWAQKTNQSKKWTSEDYIRLYVKRGDERYILVDSMASKFKIKLVNAWHLCADWTGDINTKAIRTGEWNAVNKTIAWKRGRQLGELLEMEALRDHSGNSRFIACVCDVIKLPIYDHDRMKKKLAYQSGHLRSWTRRADMLRNLEEIYNHKLGKTQEWQSLRPKNLRSISK